MSTKNVQTDFFYANYLVMVLILKRSYLVKQLAEYFDYNVLISGKKNVIPKKQKNNGNERIYLCYAF